jgi:two-component system sensor histidine kinase KdpD
VETHERSETVKLLEGLEIVPRRRVAHEGVFVEEMDVDAVIRRHPQVAVVDELAHTNVAGAGNARRYHDVEDLLPAGIHVISTLNIQHLESFYHKAGSIIGVRVHEQAPDAVLFGADEVVYVDIAAEDLQKRLRESKIYRREEVVSSLEHFFTNSHLQDPRELALSELVPELEFKRRYAAPGDGGIPSESAAPGPIMVCISSRGPSTRRLLRFAAHSPLS